MDVPLSPELEQFHSLAPAVPPTLLASSLGNNGTSDGGDEIRPRKAPDPAPAYCEGVTRSLFAKQVITPKQQLYEHFRVVLDRARAILEGNECIQEISDNNEAVARLASALTRYCDNVDLLWKQYDNEHRALTLFSSEGTTQKRYTAETRVPGSVAFAHLNPSPLSQVNAPDNPPHNLPIPQRCALASSGFRAVGVPLVMPMEVGQGSDPVTTDTLVTTCTNLATHTLAQFDASARLPNAEGARAMGQVVLNRLRESAEEVTRLVGRLRRLHGQHRIQLLHVADQRRTHAMVNRAAESGFDPLPPDEFRKT